MIRKIIMVAISAAIVLCNTLLGMDYINHSAIVLDTIHIITNASIVILRQFVTSGIVSIGDVLDTIDILWQVRVIVA